MPTKSQIESAMEQLEKLASLPASAGDRLTNDKGHAFQFDGNEFVRIPQPLMTEQDHQVRPLTEQLINAVLLDAWPGNAAIIDFGIDSTEHLGALQFAIKFGEVTP